MPDTITKRVYYVRMARGVEEELDFGEDVEDACPSLVAIPAAYEKPQRRSAAKAGEEDAATVVRFLLENLPEATVKKVCELVSKNLLEHARRHGGKLGMRG
ncbi:MAG: hypothetical protein QXH27_04160 [Candidatus Micrarchaeia archaeon]